MVDIITVESVVSLEAGSYIIVAVIFILEYHFGSI